MWFIPKENPEGRAFMTVIIIFLVLAAFFSSLRIWARRICKASLDTSDYTCFLGLVLDVGVTVILWGSFSHGYGENIWQFTTEDASFSAGVFVALEIVWNAAATAVRVSILLFYIRIFAVPRFQKLCWAVILLNLMSMVAVILAVTLICRPIAYSYNRTIPGGHCGDMISFERYTAIFNLLADAILVVLPMPILWNLQMHTRKKVGLTIILGMGVLICMLTVTRVFISAYYKPENNTKQNAIVALITGLEPIIGVSNACLPFLPSVFRRISASQLYLTASRPFRSTISSRYGHSSGGGNRGNNMAKTDMSSGSQILPRVGKRQDAFKELRDNDMEMNLLHQAHLGDLGDRHRRDYTISGGFSGSPKEESAERVEQPPWGWRKGMGGIQVRKDFTIDNDNRV